MESTDAAASGDDSAASGDDALPIELPEHLSAMTKFALTHCDVYQMKGSSFRLKCRVCGFKVTTSVHKLIYGHYLRQPNANIGKCVTLDRLQELHPLFHSALVEKQTKLAQKRRCGVLLECWLL
jgi:hypothetical protein